MKGLRRLRLLAFEMLFEQVPDQAAGRRALAPFGVELGFERSWYLNHYSHHLHGASFRQLHASK